MNLIKAIRKIHEKAKAHANKHEYENSARMRDERQRMVIDLFALTKGMFVKQILVEKYDESCKYLKDL